MIDLAQLSTTSQPAKKVLNANPSEYHSKMGFTSLLKAEQAEIQNKEYFTRAVDSFSASIRSNPKNPDPYIGLAYLFVLVDDYESGARYLAEAQKIVPDHPDVAAITQFMKDLHNSQRQSPRQALKSEVLTFPVSIDPYQDWDESAQMLEQLLAQINQCLISKEMIQPTPTTEQNMISSLSQQYQELKLTYTKIDEYLVYLEQSMHIGSFRTKLKLLEVIIKRFERAEQVSQEFITIEQRIQDEFQVVKQMYEETKDTSDSQDIPIIEENIEAILEQSQLIADQLEEYKKQGYIMTGIVKSYKTLNELIETLQEAVDEAVERLSPQTFMY